MHAKVSSLQEGKAPIRGGIAWCRGVVYLPPQVCIIFLLSLLFAAAASRPARFRVDTGSVWFRLCYRSCLALPFRILDTLVATLCIFTTSHFSPRPSYIRRLQLTTHSLVPFTKNQKDRICAAFSHCSVVCALTLQIVLPKRLVAHHNNHSVN